jgi:hypothetical protein
VSATIANGAGAQTATVAAGNYFLTSAGGVSSLITTLQTALNAASTPYPSTAAVMATVLGSGTFSGGAGWMFNIASGNDTGAFGGVTMTASGTPTYGNGGARYSTHPTDLAIKFDAGSESFSAGDNYDVTATDDLVVAWVAYFDAAPAATRAFISKYTTTGWFIQAKNNGYYQFGADRVGPANDFLFNGADVPMPIGAWHVGIAVVDRSTGKARFGVRTLAGTTSVSSEAVATASSYANAANLTIGRRADTGTDACTEAYYSAVYVAAGSGIATGLSANLSTALTNFANAINAAWTVSLDTSGGTGRVSIGWSGYATPTWSLSWTSTDLRDALGFTVNIAGVTTTQTGTAQAKGLWFPDSPLNCDDHPSMAPEDTDLRSTESPTGVVLGLSGNVKYVHTNVRWDRVPVDRIREASATYENASLEVFFRDCITGLGGHAWFTRLSKMQVYWSNAGTDTLLGADHDDGDGTSGWGLTTISKFRDIAQPSQPGWVGQFNVRFPRLVSDG